MLQDYCNRLQQLNKQKNSFLKLKYKTDGKVMIQKQQNKYHKYILSQIAYKNRLDSLFRFNQVIGQITCQQKRLAFDVFKRKDSLNRSQVSKNSKISRSRQNQNCDDQTRQNSDLNSLKMINESMGPLKQKIKKISVNLMAKWVSNLQKNSEKLAFKSLQKHSKVLCQIKSLFGLIERKNQFHKNVFFQKIKNNKTKEQKKIQNENRQSKESRSFIFSLNEFSQIIPYTIEQESQEMSTSRIKNIEEIDSNFKPLSISKIEGPQSTQKEINQLQLMLESFEKLREQVVIMKNLLSQKNKQIKSKDEQIYKIKKDYQKKIQNLHDELSQKIQKEIQLRDSVVQRISNKSSGRLQKNNDSYLKQLQTHIIGDRSPRDNYHEDEPVNEQLLQKYMKESFEMREKMDMAREMCQQFEFDSRTQQGQIMMEIIKLLTPEERLNAFVD